MVGFAGWEMPVQYPQGQIMEHAAVRADAGVFDVSHMGRFWIGGPEAVGFLQGLITNDIERAATGQLLYAALCLESGGVIDDVTVYRFERGVLMVVNASNRAAVWEWLQDHKRTGVTIEDRSDALAQLAVQGPRAQERIARLVAEDLEPIGYYRFANCTILDVPGVLVSRNGYTGEDGFEIYPPSSAAERLWNALRECGVVPAGLGARDTLRMEMCYCLYGNELDRETSPLEAGIGWTVRWKKPDFIGKAALLRQKEQGLRKQLVGFAVQANRMARHGHVILHEERPVGVVTSGGPCPSLENRGMGLGYVSPELSTKDTTLTIDVRGSRVDAVIVDRPFYTAASHR